MAVLGRLEKVELRKAWQNEAGDFTPWLAQEENLALLGDVIGLDLELEAQEKNVGPFRADILCKDTANGDWVLIENQLERTDHTHLGQLLTYAAGLKAVTIVWIAQRFTDEHRAALDWLNEMTNERVNLFGLEVELWRIADSPMAPKFNVVSKPNNWTKSIGGGAGGSGDLTPAQESQVAFWTQFYEYVSNGDYQIKPTKPQPQNWMSIALGKSGINMTAIFSRYDSEAGTYGKHELRAEVSAWTSTAKAFYQILAKDREEIEGKFGQSLVWHNPSDKQSCRIYIRKSVDLDNLERWPEYCKWLADNLDRLHQVFSPRVKKITQAQLDAIMNEPEPE